MQSHIYLGVLVLVILFFHTGGRFNDRSPWPRLILVAIVVASGILGAILYVTVPRLLTEVESNLTVDEISEQLNQLAQHDGPHRLGAFRAVPAHLRRADSRVDAGLAGRLATAVLPHRPAEAAGPATGRVLIALVPKEEQEELRQMLVVSRQRKELLLRLIYQQRYKNVLEFWLYIHVPFTIALLSSRSCTSRRSSITGGSRGEFLIQRAAGRGLTLTQVAATCCASGAGQSGAAFENPAVALEHAIIESDAAGYLITDKGDHRHIRQRSRWRRRGWRRATSSRSATCASRCRCRAGEAALPPRLVDGHSPRRRHERASQQVGRAPTAS